MPVSYHLDPEADFVDTRCIGAVTVEDVLSHFAELEADPALPPRLDVLLDLDGMTSLPESAQLREVAGALERLKTRVEWGVCAIVASRDALFGMSRMFEVFTEGVFASTRVFRQRREAESWLAEQRSPSG